MLGIVVTEVVIIKVIISMKRDHTRIDIGLLHPEDKDQGQDLILLGEDQNQDLTLAVDQDHDRDLGLQIIDI